MRAQLTAGPLFIAASWRREVELRQSFLTLLRMREDRAQRIQMLEHMLPPSVVTKLLSPQQAITVLQVRGCARVCGRNSSGTHARTLTSCRQRKEMCGVLFASIDDFDEMTAVSKPRDLVVMLNCIFCEFDLLVDKVRRTRMGLSDAPTPAACAPAQVKVYKVETIGASNVCPLVRVRWHDLADGVWVGAAGGVFMASAGVPDEADGGEPPAVKLCSLALLMQGGSAHPTRCSLSGARPPSLGARRALTAREQPPSRGSSSSSRRSSR